MTDFSSPDWEDATPGMPPPAQGTVPAPAKTRQPPNFSSPEWETQSAAPQSQAPGAQPEWSGSFLPVSQYKGNPWQWDFNAGLPGAVKSAFTLPHDVATGQIQVGSPEFISRTVNAAGLSTPGAPGVMARASIPGSEALFALGDKQYDAARDLGVHYTVPSVVDMAKGVTQHLYNSAFSPVTEPKTFGILSELSQPVSGATSAPLSGLLSARKALGRMAMNKMEAERAAAAEAKDHLDNFMENPDPANVLEGDANQAAGLIKEANGNWGAAARSNKLTTTEEHAENQTRPTADALRSYLRTMMDPRHPERMAGFNDQEKQAISNFMNPSVTQNTLGKIGHTFLGSHGEPNALWSILGEQLGQHAGESLSASVAGLAAPYVIGRTSNAASEALAGRQFRLVDELVRSRSPAGQAASAQTGLSSGWRTAGKGLGKTLLGQTPSSGLGAIQTMDLPPRQPAYPGAPIQELTD